MHSGRRSLTTTIRFLEENQQSATIVEYIASKYALTLNPQKTLQQNAWSLIDNLMQYTGNLDDDEPQPMIIENLRQQIIPAFKDKLNVMAYTGKWYTAASIPRPFDRGTAWKTADYELFPTREGQSPIIRVTNTAYNQDNSVRGKITGTARSVEPDNPAALYVSFPTGQPGPTETPKANYLIHDTDYESYAIVGSYDGSNLYLLVRHRPVAREFYNRLVEYAQRLGYDVRKLVEDYGAVQ